MAGQGRRARPELREHTQRIMLEAGLRLLKEKGAAPDLLSHIKAGDVALQSNLTHGALYYYWKSQENYRAHLLRFVMDPRVHKPVQPAWAQIDDILNMGAGSPETIVRSAADTAYETLRHDPLFRTRLHALSTTSDQDTTKEALVGYYRDSEAAVHDRFEEILRDWGLRPAPPLTAAQILSMFTALLDGFTMRGMVQPEILEPGGSESLVATAFWRIFASCTVAAETAEGGKHVDNQDADQDVSG